MTLLTAPDVPFSPYYRGGQSVSPKALRPPKSGAVGLKGHDRTAFGIVAPGRARVARRPPGGSRRAPRPRSAPLPRPPPVRALARPAHQAPLAALRLAPHQFAARIDGDRGVQSLIDQDQEQPEYSDLPPVGELPRVRRVRDSGKPCPKPKQVCLVFGACRCVICRWDRMGRLSGLHACQQRAAARFMALVPPLPRPSFRLWVVL